MDALSFLAELQARDVISFASGMGIGSMTSAVITYRLARHAKTADARIDADRKLFAELQALLPHETILWLEQIGSSFKEDRLDPLRAFDELKKPDLFFHEEDTNRRLVALQNAVSEMLVFIGYETFDRGNGMQGAAPEWKVDDPARYERVVNELDQHAHAVVAAYSELARTAKKRLNV